MKKNLLLLLVAFLSSAPALVSAELFVDKWTDADTAREAAYLVLHIADWGQTRNIAHREGEGYWEINPILGKHPSIKRIDSYMAFSMLAHIGIAYALPRGWREAFQYTTVGIEAGVVFNNNSIGLRVDF